VSAQKCVANKTSKVEFKVQAYPMAIFLPLKFSQENNLCFLISNIIKHMSLSTPHFSTDVYVGNIYINIPKAPYFVSKTTRCTQTVHITTYKATASQQTYSWFGEEEAIFEAFYIPQ